MAQSKVDWYGADVILAVETATAEALMALGFQIEGLAKINIQQNGQIDTGFMVNSGYTTWKAGDGGSGYSQARADAESRNPAGGMAPAVEMPDGAFAAVAFGAEYAIYQEAMQPFLYTALERVAADAGGTLREVARDKGLT